MFLHWIFIYLQFFLNKFFYVVFTYPMYLFVNLKSYFQFFEIRFNVILINKVKKKKSILKICIKII